MVINKSDYEEPRCVLCMDENKNIHPIDMRRVTAKLDELLDRQEWSQAESLLSYWLTEAKTGNDLRGEFSVLNEIMGLKRKLGKADEAIKAANDALLAGEKLGNLDTVGGATVFVNAGTVYEAFGKETEAVPLYEKALPIYEKFLPQNHPKLGGLYNNLAMALAMTGRFDEAFAFYDKALKVMSQNEGGDLECALTYLNMANAYEAESGLEDAADKIESCLENAIKLLDSDKLERSGYYAYMADKCIETFSYYGYFMYAKELKERVKDIYDRIRAC